MSIRIQTGLDRLLADQTLLDGLGGRIGYLGHEASVTSGLKPGYLALNELTGKRLSCLFGPQHGFQTLDQDNMQETPHQIHPTLHIPVYSLYSETREPTPEMLADLDTLIVDLQDVGTRVYTYIWTLFLSLRACGRQQVRVVVLDRPNPAGGILMEGNLPLPAWFSFVCLDSLPMRHGMTIGELTRWMLDRMDPRPDCHVVRMSGWQRDWLWKETGLTWINPSPNLATPESALIYPGSVLIEGTTLSEGRGTTRSLEQFGHPRLEPFQMHGVISQGLQAAGQSGMVLRPVVFKPTFDKHARRACGGYQIHVIDPVPFRPWKTFQHILKILYHSGNIDPFWNTDPYEYETRGLAIDYINADPAVRQWIEHNGPARELDEMEHHAITTFNELRKPYLLY